VTWWMFICEI